MNQLRPHCKISSKVDHEDMAVLKLSTVIHAPITICFDLACSIDLHQTSMVQHDEKAVDGVTSGLIGLQQQVTWEARHFGVRQRLTSRITGFERPTHFRDEMVKGPFKFIIHDHQFNAVDETTYMYDRFEFESPGWIAGKIIDKLFMTRYLKNLIIKRNALIKDYAESAKWKLILK